MITQTKLEIKIEIKFNLVKLVRARERERYLLNEEERKEWREEGLRIKKEISNRLSIWYCLRGTKKRHIRFEIPPPFCYFLLPVLVYLLFKRENIERDTQVTWHKRLLGRYNFFLLSPIFLLPTDDWGLFVSRS